MLLVLGVLVLLSQAEGGTPFAFDDLGAVSMETACVLLFAGTLINKTVEADGRRDERLDPPPSSLTGFLRRSRLRRAKSSSTEIDCPSCGYSNSSRAFFCVACNSALWSQGTPSGKPPERSVVEHKIRMRIGMRKAKHILVLIVISVIIISPLWTNVALGYLTVNDSSLSIRMTFVWQRGQTNGSLLIALALWSPTGVWVESTSPTYIVKYGGLPWPYSGCPQPPIADPEHPGFTILCDLAIAGINQNTLSMSIVDITVSTVASFGIYRQQVVRSASAICYGCNSVPLAPIP